MAVDGKPPRGSRTTDTTVHLPAATRHNPQIVLARRRVEAKSNEIPAFTPPSSPRFRRRRRASGPYRAIAVPRNHEPVREREKPVTPRRERGFPQATCRRDTSCDVGSISVRKPDAAHRRRSVNPARPVPVGHRRPGPVIADTGASPKNVVMKKVRVFKVQPAVLPRPRIPAGGRNADTASLMRFVLTCNLEDLNALPMRANHQTRPDLTSRPVGERHGSPPDLPGTRT